VTERRRGLGKGLGALIPTQPPSPTGSDAARSSVIDLAATERGTAPRGVDAVLDAADTVNEAHPREDGPPLAAHYAELPLDAIAPNPRQPRQVFDEDALAELVHSLREIGLLQPVVVRPLGGGRYELVAGERRWRAAQAAGFPLIPAIVRDTADDALLRDALLENLHRAQLNPLEEAAAYDQLLQDFGCTQDELAARIGRSRPQVSNTLRLLRLPPEVARRVAAGVLSAGHARALLALPDDATMDALAKRIVAEGLSVRAVEEIVAVGWTDPQAESVATPRAGRGRRPNAPALRAVAEALSERLDTRVFVAMGRRKGTLSVDFASLDDLARILAVLDPATAGLLDTTADTGTQEEPS
jgi:ParB family transcriptional regulator, chromosome partitioning protein